MSKLMHLGHVVGGGSEAPIEEIKVNGTTVEPVDKVVDINIPKDSFSGTTAEVQAAITAGTITNGMTVYITDDEGSDGCKLDTLEEISAVSDDSISQYYAGANAVKQVSDSLTASDSTTFNYGVKDGVRGFFTNPSRADDCFVPFSSGGKIILVASKYWDSVSYELKPKYMDDEYLSYTASYGSGGQTVETGYYIAKKKFSIKAISKMSNTTPNALRFYRGGTLIREIQSGFICGDIEPIDLEIGDKMVVYSPNGTSGWFVCTLVV